MGLHRQNHNLSVRMGDRGIAFPVAQPTASSAGPAPGAEIMNKKLLLPVIAIGGLTCGTLLAAPAVKPGKGKTAVEVFDPFALTTVSATTVTTSTTTSDIGTIPTSDSPLVVGSLIIGEHHKSWHKTKKKPHPNPPGNDFGPGNPGGPQP